MAYLTTEKTDLGENAAAVLTAAQEIQTDYTCPWTIALSAKIRIWYACQIWAGEAAEIIQQHTTQSKAETAVCLSGPDKHSFFKETNYGSRMQLLKLNTHNTFTVSMWPCMLKCNSTVLCCLRMFWEASSGNLSSGQREYQNFFTYLRSSVFTDGACGVFIDGTSASG